MSAAIELSGAVGLSAACRALDVARATLHRFRAPKPPKNACTRKTPPRALGPDERKRVIETLHSERFMDLAPYEVYGTLLDEGRYLCSIRSMYRILHEYQEVKERRRIRRHPSYSPPVLLATGPNQVWSWDITKMRGPGRWQFFSLYVVLDIFSRLVVGWLLADRECQELARRLIEETCRKHEIGANELSIHADRGGPMKSQTVAQLMATLGVTKSHSRPHVSNDNPFSESQFKTMKYHPSFPESFGSIEDGISFCRQFFSWYNEEHRHSGLGLLTPRAVHTGEAEAITEGRRETLARAYAAHPERFVAGRPQPPMPPAAVWINPPSATQAGELTEEAKPHLPPEAQPEPGRRSSRWMGGERSHEAGGGDVEPAARDDHASRADETTTPCPPEAQSEPGRRSSPMGGERSHEARGCEMDRRTGKGAATDRADPGKPGRYSTATVAAESTKSPRRRAEVPPEPAPSEVSEALRDEPLRAQMRSAACAQPGQGADGPSASELALDAVSAGQTTRSRAQGRRPPATSSAARARPGTIREGEAQ